MNFPRRGLYAITQIEGKSDDKILDEVHTVLKAGVQVIQYRDKASVNTDKLARALLSLCQIYHVPLIINDNIELAKKIRASGVHLGRHDIDLAEARQVLGTGFIIGISCYDDIDRAIQAEQQGADYVAFGRFFPSKTKPQATPAPIKILQLAKRQINCPIVAIGGILPENAGSLLAAGADLLAVVGGLFNHRNPEQILQAYLSVFDNQPC